MPYKNFYFSTLKKQEIFLLKSVRRVQANINTVCCLIRPGRLESDVPTFQVHAVHGTSHLQPVSERRAIGSYFKAEKIHSFKFLYSGFLLP